MTQKIRKEYFHSGAKMYVNYNSWKRILEKGRLFIQFLFACVFVYIEVYFI